MTVGTGPVGDGQAVVAELTLRRLVARPVDVPLDPPVQTSGGEIRVAPLVLVDLETEEGITGRSYVFCYAAAALGPTAQLVTNIGDLLAEHRVAPLAIERTLRGRFRLLGTQGLAGMAMAAVDVAAWDALARAVELPLVTLLGADPRPIPAYASLRTMTLASSPREAERAAESGFTAYKVKAGHPDVGTDLEVIQALRAAVGESAQIAIDYNQSLTVPEAVRRARHLEHEHLLWIEEPTAADDLYGHAQIRRQVTTPIQIGENWWSARDLANSLAAGASDFGMPDANKVGGVTGWLRAAALAEPAGLPLSSHIFPEVSTHLLAATPTAHLLEHLDFAGAILQTPVAITDGHASVLPGPGVGLEWDEDAVRRCLAT